MNTPSYIATLVRPMGKQSSERKAWSVGINTTWIPFFTACNLQGVTFIPAEALGCPMRLGYGKDGSVRFGNNGKPVIRVAPELAGSIHLVRENFIAGLQNYASQIAKDNAEAYASLVAHNQAKGLPIAEKQNADLAKALEAHAAAELAETEPVRELVPV